MRNTNNENSHKKFQKVLKFDAEAFKDTKH